MISISKPCTRVILIEINKATRHDSVIVRHACASTVDMYWQITIECNLSDQFDSRFVMWREAKETIILAAATGALLHEKSLIHRLAN